MTDVRTGPATPDLWQVWRTLRLRSLLDAPDAFGSTHDRERGFDEAAWRARLEGTSGPAFLAYADGHPAGLGGGWVHEPGRVTVVAMWTAPEWRGHGLGRAVLDEVVGWAREHGLRPELWVADTNPAARRLYERYGFRADGRSEPLREGSRVTKSHLTL